MSLRELRCVLKLLNSLPHPLGIPHGPDLVSLSLSLSPSLSLSHTHTHTDNSVGQELVDGGESNPGGVSTGELLLDHLQGGQEKGGGIRDSVGQQHHQLV